LRQHRDIEVSGATLECTFYGSGTPVVLLANAGRGTGYFGDLVRALAAGALQTISVNMRGTGESRGSLDGITVHDLAADVAGVLEALDCGPAHLVGHAFGNRIARRILSARTMSWWNSRLPARSMTTAKPGSTPATSSRSRTGRSPPGGHTERWRINEVNAGFSGCHAI
jgi:hypothetical protein